MSTALPPRDEGNWAAKVERLSVAPDRMAHGFNLDGHRLAGPHQGFGPLWDRIFTISLGDGVTPESLVADWRAHFGEYWPKLARFYGGTAAIQPGDVAPLTASGVTTGVLVIYADETSFSYLTPEGHMFAGMITFSARREEGRGCVAEIRMLVRPADPLFLAMWPLGKPSEGSFWKETLRRLAAAHGVVGVEPVEASTCVDRAILWRNWRNVLRNGAIVTVLHATTAPFRRHHRAAA